MGITQIETEDEYKKMMTIQDISCRDNRDNNTPWLQSWECHQSTLRRVTGDNERGKRSKSNIESVGTAREKEKFQYLNPFRKHR